MSKSYGSFLTVVVCRLTDVYYGSFKMSYGYVLREFHTVLRVLFTGVI